MTAVELPVAHSTPLDRTRDEGGAVTVTVNLVVRAPAPISSLLCCAMRAHQPCHWARRPRSGRGQGVRLDHWIKTDEINSNILPLDLILLLNFKLYFTLISFTIPSQINAYSMPHHHDQSPLDLTTTIHISDMKQIL
jgi:hypothetical protein